MTYTLVLLALSTLIQPQTPRWSPGASGTHASLRGVSEVGRQGRVAWACGTGGTVLRTRDGGTTWELRSVTGAETLDFRDVQAISAEVAVVLSIGEGASSRIYRTEDGGTTWDRAFQNSEPNGFYDALAFWDAQRGLALGDPVEGRFRIQRTLDGGKTWAPIDPKGMPQALPGEGAFAASGTCLVVAGKHHAWFATGSAARARVFRTEDGGITWQVSDTPVPVGKPSRGLFSLWFHDTHTGIAVGGDYALEGEPGAAALTRDGGKTWTALPRPRGFRSAIAPLAMGPDGALLATGPAGSDLTMDLGKTWIPLSGAGFHAFGGTFGVGGKGQIGTLACR